MPTEPSPAEIYEKAADEGHRRLRMPFLEQLSTAFIAGVTIVFGVVALGIAHAYIESSFGLGPAKLAGALAFALGLVFLVVGRSELFSENFFDPIAAVIEKKQGATWPSLGRLWLTTLVLNLVGAAAMAAVFLVEGALPTGVPETLNKVAEEIAAKDWTATLARAVAAGALLTLLSYMLQAVNSVGERIAVAFMVGFLVALGPFDHVVVSAVHLVFGVWFGHAVGYADVGINIAVSTVGNVLGGVLLVTLTHTAQVKGSKSNAP